MQAKVAEIIQCDEKVKEIEENKSNNNTQDLHYSLYPVEAPGGLNTHALL